MAIAASKEDPLLLDLGGAPTQLSSQKLSFDINADGVVEQVSMPSAGSALLALDRNGNGRIDEADPAFSQLGLWKPTANGAELETLDQGNVGALSLQNAATPFRFRDPATHADLGTLRSTGIFLRGDGTAGTLRQIDVVA